MAQGRVAAVGAALMRCACGHDEAGHAALATRFCMAFGCACSEFTPERDPLVVQQLERIERKLDWVAHALLYLTPFVRPGITDPEALMPYPPAGPKGTDS